MVCRAAAVAVVARTPQRWRLPQHCCRVHVAAQDEVLKCIQELRSRSDEVRHRAAKKLRDLVKVQQREMTSEDFSKFMGDLNRCDMKWFVRNKCAVGGAVPRTMCGWQGPTPVPLTRGNLPVHSNCRPLP